jgi:hypothetical protein
VAGDTGVHGQKVTQDTVMQEQIEVYCTEMHRSTVRSKRY